jgi:hypothetical protein
MANKIKQYRYYNEDDTINNQPVYLSDGNTPVKAIHYVNGDVFGNCYPILQLGIQAIPGTKFYLNEASEPVIIGATGIYELDLGGDTEISKIQFEARSMRMINESQNAYLIVDIIYDNGEE